MTKLEIEIANAKQGIDQAIGACRRIIEKGAHLKDRNAHEERDVSELFNRLEELSALVGELD